MNIPSRFRKVGLTPESCSRSRSAQTDQQVDHGGKKGNAPSLVQSRQGNGDEIKEGRDPQCNLDIRHKEGGFDHSLGHWSKYRSRPGVQGRSKKETSRDISRDSLKGA